VAPGTPAPGAALLTAGAGASFALALLHVGMIPVGERAYAYFTAPERLIALARAGSVVPAVVTLGVAAIFAAFGVCALIAARRDRRPGLRILLVGIAGIYLLRGALVVPELVIVQHTGAPPRILAFSLVSLAIGAVYAAGLGRAFRRLGSA
jgi:hypothetical protein